MIISKIGPIQMYIERPLKRTPCAIRRDMMPIPTVLEVIDLEEVAFVEGLVEVTWVALGVNLC